MTYYLRVEAVNLGNFVYDVQDLSTVRGGGLLLLHAIEALRVDKRLNAISTGASSGLFWFTADGYEEAVTLRDEVAGHMRADLDLKHATFVVDVLKQSSPEEFFSDRERLVALNRWRQMRQPSLAIPPTRPNRPNDPVGPCEIDMIRPATAVMGGPERTEHVSESVKARRQYGRTQKQTFYKTHTNGVSDAAEFTQDFDELSHAPFGNLDRKMAVIYADGNGFGAIQSRLKSPEDLSAFDNEIKTRRNQALTSLLADIQTKDDWRSVKRRAFRIETLLWGGDELIWVVPAWKGWTALDLFFKATAGWDFRGHGMTHAAGLVFCHHNAPIHRVTHLAKALGGLAKDKARDKNSFAYEVLESFDHAGSDLAAHRRRWFQRDPQPDRRAEEMIVPAYHLDKVVPLFKTVKENLPTRKLHQIVKESLAEPDRAKRMAEDIVARLDGTTQNALKGLEPWFGTSGTFWIHVAELWDYLR